MTEKGNKKKSLFQTVILVIIGALAIEVFLLSKENMRLRTALKLQSDHFQIDTIQKGMKAPYFELENLQGERRNMSSYRGEQLFLIFFSPKCGACERGARIWKKIQDERTRGHNIRLIGVSGGKKEDIINFAHNNGLSFPILIDPNGKVFQSYKVRGIPMTIMIDPEGTVQHALFGVSQKDWHIFNEFFGVEIKIDLFKIQKSSQK